jgi:hypothetical protein
MEPQRWKEIDEIFAAALERDSAERPAFLAQACGGDEQLRVEVESLIAHVLPESIAGLPVGEEVTRLLANESRELELTSIGPYQVVKLLGTGGMGKVYLAHDQRLNRQVAVKLLSRYGAAEDERIRRSREKTVSPDGRNIFFTSDRAGHSNIWRVDADGSNLRQLTSGAGEFYPQTTPDGQWIIYQRDEVEPTLWKVPAVGGDAVVVSQTRAVRPAVSPDGRMIAYHYLDSDLNRCVLL